ncbi:MAG: Smr/MutS family protein [Gammaproteobacteria bacterium]|nr:Smr/MutS family protein [Gammaproteobacteria bacterium]
MGPDQSVSLAEATVAKKPGRDPDPLFRSTVGKVVRVKHDRIEPAKPKAAPVPRQSEAEAQQVIAEMAQGEIDSSALESGEELLYCSPGLQDRQFRKLRRGQFSIEAELDLHGLTAEEAREAVARFLTQARESGKRCVRIIHGKGRGSRDGRPVLKTGLQHWLRQRGEVLAYCSARSVDGGTGAVYVLMKRRA